MDLAELTHSLLAALAVCGGLVAVASLLPQATSRLGSIYGVQGQAGHMPALEMYRGILALAVAASHSMAFPIFKDHGILGGLVALDGRKAVAFFCVISGFVIYRSCRNLGGSQEALRSYAIRRAMRILPVLFLSIALSLLVTNNVDLSLILSEISLIGVFGLDSVSTANPTLWSIYPEILFYAVAPVIVALSGRNRIAFFLVAACILAVGDRASESHGIHVWKYFMLGMGISALDQSFGGFIDRGKRAALAVLGGVLIAIDIAWGDVFGGALSTAKEIAVEEGEGAELASVFSVGLGIGCAMMVMGTVRSATANGIASMPLFRWLGAVSYPFFAIHQVVYMAASGWRFEAPRGFSGDGAVPMAGDPIVVLATILLASLAIATVVHVAVERPFIRLGKRLGRQGGHPPLPQASTAASAAT